MPTVRKLDRQISPNPLPAVRRTAASTPTAEGADLAVARGQIGAALAGAGAAVATSATRLYSLQQQEQERQRKLAKQRADTLALTEYDNQLARWETDHLYDPQNGALTKRGKDAFNLPREIDAEFQKYASEQADVLITPEQKDGAAKLRLERQQRIGLTVRRHVEEQIQIYTANELTAKIDNTINAAQQHALDPGLVRDDLGRAEATVRELGAFMGFGPDQITQKIDAMRSDVHLGVIDRLLSADQTKAATVYFEEAKDQIAGDKIDDVQRALRAGSVKGEAQTTFDRILAEGGTLTEQRTKAKEIDDPDVRDAVLGYLEHEAAVKDAADRDIAEARNRQVYDILDRTKSVRSIPPNLWAEMSGSERSSARSYAKSLIEGVGDVTTDPKAQYGLYQQAMDDPSTFARLDLWKFKAKLGKQDFEELARLQLSIRTGERNKVDDALDPIFTDTQLLNSTLGAIGLTSEKDRNSEQALGLRRRYTSMVETEERLRGKKLSTAERQQVLDRLILNVTTEPGSWWNILPGGKSFTDVQKRGYALTIEDVPAAMRPQIVESLTKARIPVTDDTILDTYLRYLEQQAK